MWRFTSLVAAGRGALLLAICGTLSSCLLFDGGGGGARSRCGRSYVTDVYWGASAGAVGAWYGAAGPVDGGYDYGGWYDPGDGYDPTTNSGGITTDPNSDDGSGWDQPDDGSQGDPTADPGGDPGSDTSGDSSGDSSGDTSSASVTRLHLHGVTASPLPSPSPSPQPSASPVAAPSPSPSPSPSPPVADGCFTCTMGCRTDATASASGRQAIGVSDTSSEDACGSAVRTLAQWSHDTRRERLVVCQRIDVP